MAFKVGDKAKVVDKESILYNKTVELIKVGNEAYVFYFEPQKLKLVVHKDAIQETIEWESSPDKGEKNVDKLLGQNRELMEKLKIYNEGHTAYWNGNKMQQVAAMFGKQLGEEFKMKSSTGRVWIVKFTSNGLRHCHNDRKWLSANDYLNDLLTGVAEIVED